MADLPRVVITGIGLTSPNGNSLAEMRTNLLAGRSGISEYEIRHFGKTNAGVCDFDALRHQKRKDVRRGTRAGSIAVWCANETVQDSGLDLDTVDRSRVGIYTGITEHGNVETENEIHEVSQYDFDLRFWSHHHNPRTVANNPAGEITLNMGLRGPAYSLGGACAAGNLGVIQGLQMLQLDQVDVALAGGISESIHTFGIFASFHAEGALAKLDDPTKASRPFDKARDGIVVSEGGCLYTLERLEDAQRRGARIYAEVIGYHVNSDGKDFVLPDAAGQNACMRGALRSAGPRASTWSRPTPPRRPRATSSSAARSARSSATPRACGSTTPRATSATRWAPPAPSSWPGTCRPSRTASSTPPSTSTTWTPIATCAASC